MLCRCSPINLAFPVLLYVKESLSSLFFCWLFRHQAIICIGCCGNDLDMCVYANWLRNNFLHTEQKQDNFYMGMCPLRLCHMSPPLFSINLNDTLSNSTFPGPFSGFSDF